MHIDPGSAIRWPVGCSATESLAIQGGPDGKTISGAAPARGIAPIIACSDTYRHEFTGGPDGHAFYGAASFWLRFTRIPKSKLADARRALRKQAGREIRYRIPASGRFQDCLDTR